MNIYLTGPTQTMSCFPEHNLRTALFLESIEHIQQISEKVYVKGLF